VLRLLLRLLLLQLLVQLLVGACWWLPLPCTCNPLLHWLRKLCHVSSLLPKLALTYRDRR